MVLNPLLYRRLERLFGTVKVGSPGEPFVASPTFHALTGKPRLRFKARGEHYRVQCPYCRDTRSTGRLSINHAWGNYDGHDRSMNFLVMCFNQDCLSKPENRDDFLARMGSPTLMPYVPAVRKERAISARPPDLPGPCIAINKVPAGDKAATYMHGRGFNLDELVAKYHVSVCQGSRFTLAAGRVIFPVYQEDKLVGWQARYPDDLNWKTVGFPKFFTDPDMPTSQFLYNYDRARHWETGVLVEGVTDTCNFGSMCVATFGKSLSPAHCRKLAMSWPGRTFVMLYDPEEQGTDKSREVEHNLRAIFGSRLAVVWLPEGTDPGSLERSFVREYVKQEAAKQGVRVQWRLTNVGRNSTPTEAATRIG